MRRCQKERSAHTVGAEGLSYRLATALARWSRLVWERRGGENSNYFVLERAEKCPLACFIFPTNSKAQG